MTDVREGFEDCYIQAVILHVSIGLQGNRKSLIWAGDLRQVED